MEHNDVVNSDNLYSLNSSLKQQIIPLQSEIESIKQL